MASACNNTSHANTIAILPSCSINFAESSDEVSNNSEESLVAPSTITRHHVLRSYLAHLLLCRHGVSQVEFASKIAYILMLITGVMVFGAVSVVVFTYKFKRCKEVIATIVIVSAVVVAFYLLMAFYFVFNCLLQACGYVRDEDEVLPIPDPSTLYQSTPTPNDYEGLGHDLVFDPNSTAKKSPANKTPFSNLSDCDFSTFSTEYFW